MTVGSILDDILYFILSVESAIRFAIVCAKIMAYAGAVAHGAYLGEPGIFLEFQTPSLVIGKMPVEFIDIMQSEHINECLDAVRGVEVA